MLKHYEIKSHLNKLIYLSWRLALSISFSIVISVFYLQQDHWFKEKLENYINNTMSIILKSKFRCKLDNISLLTGRLDFVDIYSSSANNIDWKLHVPSVSFCLSFKDLILNLDLNIIVYCNKVKVDSAIENNKIAFIDVINNFLEYPSILPIKLKLFILDSSSLNLYDANLDKKLSLYFNGIAARYDSFIKLNISCTSGYLYYYDQVYFDNINGSLGFDIFLNDKSSFKTNEELANKNRLDNLNLNLSLDLPFYESNKHSEAHCYLRGEYKENQGLFRLNNYNQSIKFNCLLDLFDKKDFKFNGYFPLGLFKRLIDDKMGEFSSFDGAAIIQGHFFNNSDIILGDFAINFSSLLINDYEIGKWSLKGHLDGNFLNFNLNSDSKALPIIAIGKYDIFNKSALGSSDVLELKINNHDTIVFRDYVINPANIDIDLKLDKCLNISSLIADVNNNADGCLSRNINLNLIAYQKEKIFNFDLKYNDYVINSSVDIFNRKVNKLKIKEGDFLLLNIDKDHGYIDYDLIKEMLNSKLNYDLSGQGRAYLKIKDNFNEKNRIIKFNIDLKKGDIRIPYFYNILKSFNCDIIIDFYKRILEIKNLKIDFYKGQVSSLKSIVYFDENYNVYYANIPLILKNLLINHKRQFLGLIGGDINLLYNLKGESIVKGDLILGKSNFDGNSTYSNSIIKSEIIKIINPESSIFLDLNISSKSPLVIKAGYLEANSRVNINIGGSLSNIKWSGQLDLIDGKIDFAYKPFLINYGKMILNPNNIGSSTINLAAKNRIKNYNISLFVSGFINDLQIKLDSNPSLDQEQILSLLLGGNSQGTLYAAMPQMLIQTFKNYIFSGNNNTKSIFKSFKNIRFIPINIGKDNNQDVGGAVEIDINDKLSALIETDLSFSENPRIEVDYAISDDISIKGVRSTKGDLEAEMEVRLKF